MSLSKIATLLTPLLFLATAGLYAQGDDRRDALEFPRLITRINPGFQINSRFDETRPMLSEDGKTLFFARKHHPENCGGNVDPQDIFFSTTKDGIHWSEARNSGPSINTPRADNLCGIIDDSHLIFFQPSGKHQGRFIIRGGDDSRRDEEFIGPAIINESAYLEAAFSYDKQVVLYTAKTKSNIAYRKEEDERDIYFSVRTLSGWSVPRNLGQVVNTPGDEFSPFLAADGRTLYFASTGHVGYGAADVFVSRRIGESWEKWSTPENLGPRINSPRFDGYLTLSPSSGLAYMVSNANSVGRSDIIAIVLPKEHQPERHVACHFTTVDSRTLRGISAEIIITDTEGKKIAGAVTNDDGEVSIFVPGKDGLRASVRSVNYHAYERTLPDSIRNFTMVMQPLQQLVSADFGNILFEKGTTQIVPSSFAALDSLVSFLISHPRKTVELRGHTDNVGTLTALKNLSLRRVETVRLYLVSNGIDPGRISQKAFGGLRPAFENSSEESRGKNRRVELILP